MEVVDYIYIDTQSWAGNDGTKSRWEERRGKTKRQRRELFPFWLFAWLLFVLLLLLLFVCCLCLCENGRQFRRRPPPSSLHTYVFLNFPPIRERLPVDRLFTSIESNRLTEILVCVFLFTGVALINWDSKIHSAESGGIYSLLFFFFFFLPSYISSGPSMGLGGCLPLTSTRCRGNLVYISSSFLSLVLLL